MKQSITAMVSRISEILRDNSPSICLFGSVVLDDFKLGWSDIDFICLTNTPIQPPQAQELVNLRQAMSAQHPQNPYYKSFEGAMLTHNALFGNLNDTIVYWGTSGQRIIKRYQLDTFSVIELLDSGILLYGNDFRYLLQYPTRKELVDAVAYHYKTIRQYGTSWCGWILDIARCLYTLETNSIIAKTKAGEWALAKNLCPDAEIMKTTIAVRKNPLLLNDANIKKWQNELTPYIQRFADVLEAELRKHTI